MKNATIIITSCILLLVSSLKAQEAITTPTVTPKTDSLPKKVKEFGIGFTSLTAYSLQYRWGNTKRLFRVNATIGGSTTFGNGSNNSTNDQTTGSTNNTTGNSTTNSPIVFNAGLSFSMLYLKPLVKKFGLIYGPIAGVSYSTSNNQTTGTTTAVLYAPNATNNGTYPNNTTTKITSKTLQPYLGFVLGAFYKINRSFFIYAEIAPNIYYARTNSTNSTTQSVLNLNNSVGNITNNTSTSNNAFGIANLSNSGATITIVYRITTKPKAL